MNFKYSPVGEDVIVYSAKEDYAVNQELFKIKEAQSFQDLQSTRGIEVGHIFQLGDKYSQPMQAHVMTANGMIKAVEMGCYGLGLSHIVAAAIEQHQDERGICWPKAMAPFQAVIIPLSYKPKSTVQKTADNLYETLQVKGFDVLLDDREVCPGIAFSEMDLIGIPYRIIISSQNLVHDEIECEARPREKLLTQGASTLSDAGLLAVFIRSDVKGQTALDISYELFVQFRN